MSPFLGRPPLFFGDADELESCTATTPSPSLEQETAVRDGKNLYEVHYFVRDDVGHFHPRVERLRACDEFDAWLEVVTCEAEHQRRAWWCLSVQIVSETEASKYYTPETND